MVKVKQAVKPKKKYQNYNNTNLERALQALANTNISYRDAEIKYGVSKSTLQRKFNGKNGRKPGRPDVFNAAEEKLFVDGIITASKWGFPLTNFDIRMIAKAFIDRRGKREVRFTNNMPGRKWAKGFLKRHREKLSVRLAQNIKSNRAMVSKDVINDYFDQLQETLEGVSPDRIVNYDETNFTDDPGSTKVIVRRGSKHADRIIDTSKSSTSVMFAISGNGSLLPVYVVYKAIHLHDTWCVNGLPHTVYNRSRSGWFDNTLFSDWFFKVALPYFKHVGDGKKILLGDNLASHISLEIIQACEKNGIDFVLLPPNATHLLQPLDVAFFRPLKRAWNDELLKWKLKHKGLLPKDTFPLLLRNTVLSLEKSSEKTICSGFRACGLVPLDRNAVLKRIPDGLDENDASNANECLSASFIDHLKNYRLPSDEGQRIKRKKRLDVPPGKGVTAEDFNAENESNNEIIEEENNAEDGSSSSSDPGQIDSENINEMRLIETVETDGSLELSPTEGSFIVVKYIYNKDTKKETTKEFVGKILEVHENIYRVNFLRYNSTTSSFVFPNIEDTDEVEKTQVSKVLDNPKIFRGRYKFPQAVYNNLLK